MMSLILFKDTIFELILITITCQEPPTCILVKESTVNCKWLDTGSRDFESLFARRC